MRQTMDLLNLSQPWDCQRFPKSKTICYGGGGGGGGGNPVKTFTKAVSDNTPTIKVEAPPPIKIDPPKVKLPKSIKDTSLGNAANEVKKLGDGDFSLKKAVQGTASGAAETFKKSDVGKVVKKIAKETGYTGSDIDTGMQKIEKESSNVVNQTLDAVDNPTKVVQDAKDRFVQSGSNVAEDIKKVFSKYEKGIDKIGETGTKIYDAFQDTYQTGLNAAGALGTNLANQLGTASGDKGGLKGKANIADLLEQKRKGRRGGLSRSGTSRTLITGKV